MTRFDRRPSGSRGKGRPTLLLALAISLMGCDTSSAEGSGAWQVEHENVDGIEVVRTVSGSVWDTPMELVEELSIGVLDGDEVYMFGRIGAVAPDGRGGVYVFDGLVPALRHYDAEGRHVRTLGGEGEGPGEYGDAVLGMGLLSDGRLVLRDPRNGRFTFYAPDGSPAGQWTLASGLFTNRATYIDTTDHIYTRILTGPIEPDAPWPIGLLHLTPDGEILDTIPSPPFPGEPTGPGGALMPSKHWELHPHGYLVVGVSDRYALELRRPEGTLRIEKEGERIQVHPEERAEREAQREYMIEQQGQFMTSRPPPTPRIKPYFRNIYAGEDGTLWVHVHREASPRERRPEDDERAPDGPPLSLWSEPSVFEVFEADGTYLGEVHVPPQTTLYTYSLDELWAARRGEFDEVYLLRMRLEPRES